MARKVFISFLGTTDYFPSDYYRGKFCSGTEKYVQIAALSYVQRKKKWPKDSIAYILLTDLAKERNWLDNGYTDRTGKLNVGLENRFKSMKFFFPCIPISIPEGRDEKEIWQIFKTIHDLIQEGDELYFDITHAYRYLPMLVVVLGNYSKFLENAKVVQIMYGNYEGRDKDETGKYIEPPHAPIIDLQSFSILQDWTYAVADFINNGNADRMSDLTSSALAPLIKKEDERAELLNLLVASIKNFSKDMQTCRGLNIIEGTNIKDLKDYLFKIQDILAQDDGNASVDQLLLPVFGRIQKIIENYDSKTNIENGFQAVNWCIEHKLFQQAITILQESVKNYFCIKLGYDFKNGDKRRIVEGLLDMAKYKSEHMLPVEIGRSMGVTEWSREMKYIAVDYDTLRILRNDINHSGIEVFPEKPANPSYIEETIKEKFENIKTALGICL